MDDNYDIHAWLPISMFDCFKHGYWLYPYWLFVQESYNQVLITACQAQAAQSRCSESAAAATTPTRLCSLGCDCESAQAAVMPALSPSAAARAACRAWGCPALEQAELPSGAWFLPGPGTTANARCCWCNNLIPANWKLCHHASARQWHCTAWTRSLKFKTAEK